MEEVISDIIEQYGPQIWLTFVTFVVTGFVLTIMKDLVADIVYYFRARMSDIGYGQRIYWRGEIYVVQGITFKHILIKDDKKVIRIPIKSYMNGPIEFPLHRYDDFDEEKYHQPPWDGKTERRDK
jgi:hypothetical protein